MNIQINQRQGEFGTSTSKQQISQKENESNSLLNLNQQTSPNQDTNLGHSSFKRSALISAQNTRPSTIKASNTNMQNTKLSRNQIFNQKLQAKMLKNSGATQQQNQKQQKTIERASKRIRKSYSPDKIKISSKKQIELQKAKSLITKSLIRKKKNQKRGHSIFSRIFGCCRGNKEEDILKSSPNKQGNNIGTAQSGLNISFGQNSADHELKVDSSENNFQSFQEEINGSDTNMIKSNERNQAFDSQMDDSNNNEEEQLPEHITSIKDPQLKKHAIALRHRIKRCHRDGTLEVLVSSTLLKFAKSTMHNRSNQSLQVLLNIIVQELKNYMPDEEFKIFKQQISQFAYSQRLEGHQNNYGLDEDSSSGLVSEYPAPQQYHSNDESSSLRLLNFQRERPSQIYQRLQRFSLFPDQIQERLEQSQIRSRNPLNPPQSIMVNRSEAMASSNGLNHSETAANTQTAQNSTKKNQKVHWAEQTDQDPNQSPESPTLKQQYKNCSKAVVERDKQLRSVHQVLQEENIMQRHIDLQRAISFKLLKQSQKQNQSNASGQIDSCSKDNGAAAEKDHYMFETDPSQEFKSFICPLCFRFIYKCQITVCGHSFCTKCIDEYLIIKKNCFVCDQTIRTAKGSSLLSCFLIDDVISEMISKSADSDVMAQWETQKCEFTTWQLKKKIDKIDIGEKLDVRDTDYIWCVGEVRMIIESIQREPILAIHYEGWNMWYDEFLPMSSPRLARLGFYTSRDDIPKYQMKMKDGSSYDGSINQRGQMQAFIVNRLPQTPWTSTRKTASTVSPSKNQLKTQRRRLTQMELQSMTDEERRRYENSHLGDSLDDKIEYFLSTYQDFDYYNGNREISGLHVAHLNTQERAGSPSSFNDQNDQQPEQLWTQRQAAMNEALDDQIERQNIQQLQQGVIQPVLMRNAIQVLNSVGHGGANIANALVGQQQSHQVHHYHSHALPQGYIPFQSAASQAPSLQTNETRGLANQQFPPVPNAASSVQATGASAVGSNAGSGAPATTSSAARGNGSSNSLSTLIRQIQNIMHSNNRYG